MAQRKSAAVSMEQTLAEEAQERARALGFTFSAYVVRLIRDDLTRRGAIVVQEDCGSVPPPRKDVVYPKPPRKTKP
jgi:hypothetical protein